jgi:dihydropteroate synthase
MAIINLTPDSFWQESRKTVDTALFAAERAIKDGAAILDLGPQSTRPGYNEIPASQEIERFAKVLEKIKANFDIPVSIDTYFSESARAALELGADMINDVWGLTHDADMAEVVAKYNAAVCIMHNAKEQLRGDIFPPILQFLKDSVDLALKAGIDKNKICLDGGVGFAKDREQNWLLTENYNKLSVLGYPLLLGTSRKSMFGGKVEDRLPATLQTTRMAARDKILFVRVHDVKENYQAIKEEYERDQYKRV